MVEYFLFVQTIVILSSSVGGMECSMGLMHMSYTALNSELCDIWNKDVSQESIATLQRTLRHTSHIKSLLSLWISLLTDYSLDTFRFQGK
jgi:ABC-type sulfate transport system permease component